MTDDEQKEIISYNLQKLIERSGKQQKDIAIDLDMSSSRLNTYVKGKAIPPVPVLWQLAEYFHVQLTDIVDSKEERFDYYLTDQDRMLLKAYSNASDDIKRAVNYMIRLEEYIKGVRETNKTNNDWLYFKEVIIWKHTKQNPGNGVARLDI